MDGDSRLDERAKRLGTRFLSVAADEGYSVTEIAVAAEAVMEAAAKVALLRAILGDRLDDMMEALMRADAEEIVREAEGVLEDVDKQGDD